MEKSRRPKLIGRQSPSGGTYAPGVHTAGGWLFGERPDPGSVSSVRNHLATMLASTVSFTDPDLRGAEQRCRSGAYRRSTMRSAAHAHETERCGNGDSRAPSTRAGSHPRANADSLGLALEADRSRVRRDRRSSIWPHFHLDPCVFVDTLAWRLFLNKAGIPSESRDGAVSALVLGRGVRPRGRGRPSARRGRPGPGGRAWAYCSTRFRASVSSAARPCASSPNTAAMSAASWGAGRGRVQRLMRA